MAERDEKEGSKGGGAGAVAHSSRRILAVGLEAELFGRVEALLHRAYFEVDTVPRGEAGRVLGSVIPFDLLIVRYPLPDMEVADLIGSLRDEESPCVRAHLLLIADPERLGEAQRWVGEGADAALPADRTGDLMSKLAARLLHVAPRVAARIMVHLQVRISDGERHVFCQTADLSTSGMFVRTDESYPAETRMAFQLLLPEEREAVSGTAAVVRSAPGGANGPEGIGMRFVDFRPGCEARLRSYLARGGE